MARRTITIILVITAIIAAVAYTTLEREKAIDRVLLSDSYSTLASDPAAEVKELSEFENGSEIYVIIMLENITMDDSINVQWKRVVEEGEILVQEDTIIEKQEGTGPLVISLAKKNDMHEAGKYKLYVSLNELETIEKSFEVKE